MPTRSGIDLSALNKTLKAKHHLVIDGGYGKLKGKTFRISNMGDETDETIAALIQVAGQRARRDPEGRGLSGAADPAASAGARAGRALAAAGGGLENLAPPQSGRGRKRRGGALGEKTWSCTSACRTLTARSFMKSLIIAEKPSVAADLARSLGKIPKKGDHFENDDYVISSAVGHLVELLMPEDIDKKKYGFWRLEMLPIIPEKFELKPIEDSKERFDHLKKLLARKDLELVINACDAGREGELIFTYIYQLTKCKLPVKRAWMQTMTAEGIREAFKQLREGKQMAGLADAARCRSESDWLIGINGTRALTKRMFGSRAGNVASVGRVQTPTLAIVYARELEIRNFKPRTYWQVSALFEVAKGQYEGLYQRPNFKRAEDDEHDRIDRIWDQAAAEAVFAACQGQPAALRDRGEESQHLGFAAPLRPHHPPAGGEQPLRPARPPHLADRPGPLRAAQDDHLPAHRLAGAARGLHPHRAPGADQPPGRPRRPCEQGARGAVAAAEQADLQQRADLRPLRDHPDRHRAEAPRGHGGEDLRHDRPALRGGLLPAGRIRHHDPPQRGRRPPVQDRGQGPHRARAGSPSTARPRWTTIRRTRRPCPRSRRPTGPRRRRRRSTPQLHRESTKPPPRYTEATLLSAMEGAGKLVEDEELAEAMKERGLGTPATRADTIDGLINQRYVERAQRELIPTAKAEQVIQFLGAVKAEQLTSPAMTGEWEFKLRQMEHGKFPRAKFMDEVADQTRGIIERVKAFEEDESVARVTDILSPTDGKPLKETLRGYKSQDGELMVYKVIGGRKMAESEVQDILGKGQIGPLDGFRSAKSGKAYSAVLRYNPEEKKVEFVFDGQRDANGAMKIDFTGLQPVAPAPAKFGEGAQIYETAQSYVVRKIENGEDKILAKCSRRILSRDIPREQFVKLLETGKTDLLEKFWSQRTRRPFSAFLVLKEDGNTAFEFAPAGPEGPQRPQEEGLSPEGGGRAAAEAPAAEPPAS